jgi:protoheme ferro-lyase
MDKDMDILTPLMKLPADERAAALAHWIYVQTGLKDSNWSMRVAESWNDLDVKAKEFNIHAIETWAEHPHVLQAWVDAVHDFQKKRDRRQQSA